ncbi:MAG: NTP transferase domain-containing protein [Candidatus Didemnitutus sp.]|nr:NTP transferase domain-containing protein [Candidatus Didemnitutus sp.]
MNFGCRISFAGAVLAGPRSGKTESDLPLRVVGGERLIDRQLELLLTLGPAELVIAGQPRQDYGCPGVLVTCQAGPDQGFLGDLAAVFAATTSPHVLVAAVDLPPVSPYLLCEVFEQRSGDRGVVPRTGLGWEPRMAVYPRICAARVLEHLRTGQLDPIQFVESAVAAGELKPHSLDDDDAAVLENWQRERPL